MWIFTIFNRALLLIMLLFLADGFLQHFRFMSDVSCPSLNEEFKTVLHCAANCSWNYYCNGFVWSPDTRQCLLVYLLTINTSFRGPCRYFLKPYIIPLLQRCPNYYISVPSSKDRLFLYTASKIVGNLSESRCTSLGGILADMYQDNTMLEVKKIVYDFYLRQNMDPCIKYSPTNVQCYLVIGTKTIGGENLRQSSNVYPLAR